MLDLKSSFFWYWETLLASKNIPVVFFLLPVLEEKTHLALASLGLLVLDLPW